MLAVVLTEQDWNQFCGERERETERLRDQSADSGTLWTEL